MLFYHQSQVLVAGSKMNFETRVKVAKLLHPLFTFAPFIIHFYGNNFLYNKSQFFQKATFVRLWKSMWIVRHRVNSFPNIPGFNDPKKCLFKTKRKKMMVTSIFSFSHNILYTMKYRIFILATCFVSKCFEICPVQSIFMW